MNIVSRGIRNAFRNVVRTVSIVIILGISIGLALTMLVARQTVQQKINSIQSSVDNTVTITPAGIQGFQGGGNLLTTNELNKVKSLPHVIAITENLSDRLTTSDTNLVSPINPGNFGRRQNNINIQSFGGGAFSRNNGSGFTTNFTIPILVTGTSNPSISSTSNGGTLNIISGSEINGTIDKDIALVGSNLASKNNLKIGSTFSAYSTTFTVAGIFDSGNTFTNGGIIMPLPTVQRLSNQSSDISSAVAQIDSISNLNTAVNEIKNSLGANTADVTSSQQAANSAVVPLNSIKTISVYSLIGAVIAGSVIVLLVMIMIVRERRREIGVIKAIGASNARVMFQFVTESVTLTLLGSVIGLLIGIAGSGPVTNLLVTNSASNGSSGISAGGIHSAAGGFIRQFRAGGVLGIRNIHAVVGWNIVIYGILAAITIAIIGSALASGLIAKIRPAEVMRTE